jgi:hypothetical protein
MSYRQQHVKIQSQTAEAESHSCGKEMPLHSWHPVINDRPLHKNPQLDPIPSQINPIRALSPLP